MKTANTPNPRDAGISRRSRFCSRQLPCSRSRLSQFALAPHTVPREIHHEFESVVSSRIGAITVNGQGRATYMGPTTVVTTDQLVSMIDERTRH